MKVYCQRHFPDSIVLDIAVILFVIMMAYVNVVLVGDIWGIEIPRF